MNPKIPVNDNGYNANKSMPLIAHTGLKAYKEMLDLREDSEEFVRRVEAGLGLERQAGDEN